MVYDITSLYWSTRIAAHRSVRVELSDAPEEKVQVRREHEENIQQEQSRELSEWKASPSKNGPMTSELNVQLNKKLQSYNIIATDTTVRNWLEISTSIEKI